MKEPLISVIEAERILFDNLSPLLDHEDGLLQCVGKVLNQPVYADRNLPPFDRATMDGFAIRFQDFENGIHKFRVSGFQPAGERQLRLTPAQDCIEVMTGAIMPEHADTVIPYERCTVNDGFVFIEANISKGQNVHLEGSDRRKGDLLLRPGTPITPAEIGILATVGKTVVNILKPPKIAIVSTGDELVDINQTPELHQIRKSNSLALLSALYQHGLSGNLYHLNDNKEEIRCQLWDILQDHEVVLLSGGVSKGKKDFIPQALAELGIDKLFHRVAQRPGKPLFFGKSGNVTVFGFPGNPVSTFLCFYRYFVPWYNKSSGSSEKNKDFAILDQDVIFESNLTYFLPVKVRVSDEGKVIATPAPGNGSGDLMNLTETDAFIELPAEKFSFKKGSCYPLYRYRY